MGVFSFAKNQIVNNSSAAQAAEKATGKAAPAPLFAMVCFGLLASLPFLQPFHSQPIPSFYTECLALLLGLSACVCVFVRASDTLVLPKVAMLPLALAGVVLLQVLAAKFSYAVNAALVIFYLAWSAALACAAANLTQQIGSARLIALLCWALFASGVVSALCGLAQYAGIVEAFGGWICEPMDLSRHGIYGNLSQQNHFATHLALAMGSGLYLWLSARLARLWLLPTLALMGMALLLSGSRSAFLYLPWIALLALLHARCAGRLRLPPRLGAWLACGIVAAAALLWLLAHFKHIPQLARLFDFSAAFGPRVFLWQHAWAMFLHHPLLGVGFEGFAAELIVQIGELHRANPWSVDPYAHDLLLQLMAVSGLCGFLAFAVPACLFAKRQLALALTAERFWLWSVLGILALHSLLEQPLFYSYFLGLAAIAAGMADTAVSMRGMNRPARVAVCLCGTAAILVALKTSYDYGRLADAVFGERSAFVDQARKRALLLELHSSSLFSPLAELSAPQLFAPDPATAQTNLAFNERVMHYAPTAEVEFRHAVLLADAGDANAAMRQFDQAAYAYPEYVKEYAQRFDVLGKSDAERYGMLAAHVHDFMQQH